MSRPNSGFITLCFCKEEKVSPCPGITCHVGEGQAQRKALNEQHCFLSLSTSTGSSYILLHPGFSHTNTPFIPSSHSHQKASTELMRNDLFLMSHVKEMWAALFRYHKKTCFDKQVELWLGRRRPAFQYRALCFSPEPVC